MRRVTGRQTAAVIEQLRHYGSPGYARLRAASPAEWQRAADLTVHHDYPVAVVASIGAQVDGVLIAATVLGLWLSCDGEQVHVPLDQVLDVTVTGPKVHRSRPDGDEQDGNQQ